ncbi:PCDGE protein, partial [Vireo altiloquus]|nr:PCDGE protein [Vireo altiloquus]
GGERALLAAVLLCLWWRAAAERVRYSIPEELGRGSLVGPLARDLGLSADELPARKLRLSEEKQYFTVNEENGNLYVNERLDREEMCGASPTCSVSFEALVHNPLNIFRVEVTIEDVNDNSPAFRKPSLDLEIGELIPPGARSPLERARDADVGSNSLLTYQLTGNPSFSLALKEKPGGKKQPEVVLERALDREKQSSFELVLMAVDGGDPARSGTVQVRINVTDANDNPPVFSKRIYEARVAENLPVGSLVLRMVATDADSGSNGRVSYFFGDVPDDVPLIFAIDSESGEIRTAGPLDFEENSQYSFGLEARDGGGLTDHCEVQIDITDENDNAPEISILSLSSPVPEDAPTGTVVALLKVRDRDSGENGQVSCELSGEAPLSIVVSSGGSYKVVTASALDREQASEHRVTVLALMAVDGGDPARSGTVQVRINVTDANDNPPVFSKRIYEARVAENLPVGSLVLRMVATDADAGSNGRVSYFFGDVPDDVPLIFAIDSESGEIRTAGPLDFEENSQYSFGLEARDGGGLTDHCEVQIDITDENDNAPEI